ncbi:urease accessory protein UreH domain-containing protein, partial [Pseudothauera rhizosphaerae]|uniref:urease accessory protein UreH domain-containing protein n=1 Tax=Pseudothauera rhizosphaerae TaxID=2565932 RepID=UPI001B3B2AC0
ALSARLVGALRTLLAAPGAGAPLALGVANGLLPCPLVYAFTAQAAAAGGLLPGLSTMAAFGLGTFPMMLLAGGLGLRLHPPVVPVVVLPGVAQGSRMNRRRCCPAAEPPLPPNARSGTGFLPLPSRERAGERGLPARAEESRDFVRLPWGLAARRGGVRIAGAFIVLLGLVTCARGLLPLAGALHHVHLP